MSKEEDRKLIAGYLDGDTQAVSQVEGWVAERVATRFAGLAPELDDLRQQVHGVLVKALGEQRFRHEASLRTYVSRIADYTAMDVLHRRRREPSAPAPGETQHAPVGPQQHSRLERAERRELVRKALAESPQPCRRLWQMVFVDRMDYKTIGRKLGVPVGTVKSRMWHCRRQLIAAIARWEAGSKKD